MPQKDITYGVDGLPNPLAVAKAQTDLGLCLICLQACRVGVHKAGGYYSNCRHCGTRLYTMRPEGTTLFRALQRVFRNEKFRDVVMRTLLEEAEHVSAETAEREQGSAGRPA